MNGINNHSHRTGHTLIELMVAMVASVALLGGLGSVMLIARHVAYTPSGATSRTEAAEILSGLTDELQYATFLVGYSDKILEFVVSDRNADGTAEKIRYEWSGTSGDPLLKSINGNTASVIAEAVDDCQFDLKSSVGPGPPALLVRLQISDADPNDDDRHSRVDAAIPLISRPELLSAYWRADFDPAPALSPTAIDIDASGGPDWVASNGASFNISTLQDGTWHANGDLATNPANDFVKTTIIEARCKNTAAAGVDADLLRVNADRNGAAYAALVIRMRRELDGSQALRILELPTNGVPIDLPDDPDTDSILTTNKVENLPDDYVRFRLVILPTLKKVNLQVNGEDVGMYTYETNGPSSSDQCVKLLGSGGGKFDYVEVRVLPN